MSTNTNNEERSIIFSLGDSEDGEMAHTYLEYKIDMLPTQEELKQAVVENVDYSILMLSMNCKYETLNIYNLHREFSSNKGGWSCSMINTNYEIGRVPYILRIEGNELYYSFTASFVREIELHKLNEVILDVENALQFFKNKSLEYKKHNTNYVVEMTIKYVNSVLDNMELYLKISYLLLSIKATIPFKSVNIDTTYVKYDDYTSINNIHTCEDDYKKLYNIIIEYIHNNS